MIHNSAIITSEQRVEMERHTNVRCALRLLTTDYHEKVSREQVREHVVTVMLDSVHKQARWSS